MCIRICTYILLRIRGMDSMLGSPDKNFLFHSSRFVRSLFCSLDLMFDSQVIGIIRPVMFQADPALWSF